MKSHENQGSAGCEIALLAAVHTLAELKLGGNHLKGSRPVLSFHAVSRIPAASPFGQSTVSQFAFIITLGEDYCYHVFLESRGQCHKSQNVS